MRKISLLALSLVILLSGCAPNFQKQENVVQTKEEAEEKAIIPKYNISDNYYRTILPFEPGEARGLIVGNINTRYDINEFETGLMRIAQHQFDPKTYLFREGQELKRNTVRMWLNRKFTPAQLEDEGLEEDENIGLNPLMPDNADFKAGNSNSPIYLAHILEHDYLIKGENDTVKLGGVVIGLALNSVHYFRTAVGEPYFEREIEFAEMEREGKKIADEVLKRLRAMKNLKDVPITIALFNQQSKSSVVPGTFFTYAKVDKGSSTINAWEPVAEKYFLFPSTEAQEAHRDDVTAFLNFKQDVEAYFPNFNGVIGRAFYIGDQFHDLDITIPIQFYGKSEAIGFTQYVTGLVLEHFPDYISVSVSVTSVDGPEALIVRKANEAEPFVHIY
ncbi:CamS family sex pheromone protein [Neobacillus niacini]|uniref:CamS family sex pheromone protein n=1 Tax=Neobacillus niacini TaxID=86668 RepID=UPI001C8D2F1F|nr:CamS family sex pheromone protein [Neobacillus niacini]MBY0147702.1 CamS family sex pheromone protein [Neobacillus niacini]